MKNKYLCIIPLGILLTVLCAASLNKKNSSVITTTYLPVNTGLTLVYQSSFGESVTNYIQDGELTISSSKADKFKYKQTLQIKNDGVYSLETYQYLKVLLFIKKEATITYNKPLLRFPLPLSPGMKWEWNGKEYSDGDTNTLTVNGQALCKESVVTKAGTFDAIKIESIIVSSSNGKNRVTEWYVEGVGLIKAKIIIEGGGLMGTLRDILGYGTIEFELKDMRKI
jgi:hypothetical protein